MFNETVKKILERDTPQRGAGFISHRDGDALKELVDAFEVGNRMDTEEAVLVTQIRAIFNSNNHDVQNAVIDLLKTLSTHSNKTYQYVARTILTIIPHQS